jgi:uncharacterized protein
MNNENFMGNIDLKKVKEYAISRFKLCSNFHGIEHWNRVYYFGMKLAEADSNVNKRVVALFAYLHDCERKDDFYDLQHGKRSAKKLYILSESLLKDLSDDEFELLYKAICHHNSGKITKNPTIGACFDADRLDLGRCGITLDPDLMSTQKGKEFALQEDLDDL